MNREVEYPGEWVALCPLEELVEGEATVFKVNGYEIYIIIKDGNVKTYYGRCPHALGELLPSDFDGERIVCHVHGWTYDALTGKGINPRNSELFTLDNDIRNGILYVKVPIISVSKFLEKYFRRYSGS